MSRSENRLEQQDAQSNLALVSMNRAVLVLDACACMKVHLGAGIV